MNHDSTTPRPDPTAGNLPDGDPAEVPPGGDEPFTAEALDGDQMVEKLTHDDVTEKYDGE